MKRFLVSLVALALLMSIMPLAIAEEQTIVNIAWWGGQARHDATTLMIREFEEQHPEIKVNFEFSDFNGHFSKLATQAAGGLLPDIIQMDYAYLTQYVENGILADITPYTENGAINVADISNSVLSTGMVNGKLYAMPTGTNVPVTAYRKDIADEAGVTLPVDLTWEEWIEASKTIYEKLGRKDDCIVYMGEKYRYAVRDNGLNLFNEDNTALGFDDPTYLVEIWQRVIDAVNEGYGQAPGERTASSDFDRYVNDTWINIIWSNQVASFEKGSDCELELCAIPKREGATQAAEYFKPTMFWAVTETSKVKDAAAVFIDFFTNSTDCFDIVGIDRGMPVSAKIREYLTPNFDKTSQKIAAIMDWMGEEGNSSPIMNPDPACYSETHALVGDYTEQVQYGLVDDLTAHALAYMEEANEIIARANKAE